MGGWTGKEKGGCVDGGGQARGRADVRTGGRGSKRVDELAD